MKDSASEKGHKTEIKFITDDNFDNEDLRAFSELTNWQPLYNLYTTSEAVIVHLELPGVELNDIVVFLRSRYMVIAGNRVTPPGITENCCIFHNLEIPFGRFHRRIDFPMQVETREHRYESQNGILTIQFRTVQEKFITIEGE
jgi:HSP20 family molecular chaperone IbpA